MGDVGVIQEVSLNLGQVKGSTWRPALAGVALTSPYLTSWQMKLVAGTDAFGDQFVRAIGSAALGSSVKQTTRWTAAGYSAWHTTPMGVSLQHHTLSAPPENSWVEDVDPIQPAPDRLVLSSSTLCEAKVQLVQKYLQAGTPRIAIVSENIAYDAFRELWPYRQHVSLYLSEHAVSTLGYGLTQHIGFFSAWSDERAALGASVLAGQGFDATVIAAGGLAVSRDLPPQKEACPAHSATPWRPSEDHYLLAFYMLAAAYNDQGVQRPLQEAYRMAAAELVQGRKVWFEALNRQLLV